MSGVLENRMSLTDKLTAVLAGVGDFANQRGQSHGQVKAPLRIVTLDPTHFHRNAHQGGSSRSAPREAPEAR